MILSCEMPRPKPLYLRREVTRHGQVVWYVRRNEGKRTRLKSTFGTNEFWAEYREALKGQPQQKGAPIAGTLAWLVTRYKETGAWTDLSAATRKQRGNVLRSVLETAGGESFKAVTLKSIEDGKGRRSQTPHQARHFLDAMRGLFRWAKDAQFVSVDPTLGVTNPPRKRGKGFPPWKEEDVAAYYKKWPLGTRERVWLDVLLYTGLRRGDVVTVGKQHVGGFIKTEKSGHTVEVPVIVLPSLQATLDAGPCGDLTFIVGANGNPFTKESFGNQFRKACREAGLVDKSAHGVRKLAATRMAENGATEAQLMAVFGWTDPKMAAHYTRSANRRRLARESIDKLNDTGTETAAPSGVVRRISRKSQ